MFNLIIKDILIQKKILIFTFIYSIFIFFALSTFQQTLYIMGSMAIGYILVTNALNFEEKSNSEILVNSLPLKRNQIVFAKYLSVFLYLLIGLTLTGITGALINISGVNLSVRFISFMDVVIAFLCLGLLVSLYYPIYFKFQSNILKIINIFFFITAFFLPNFIVENRNENFIIKLFKLIENVPLWLLESYTLIFTLVVMFTSLFISIKIYNNKDL